MGAGQRDCGGVPRPVRSLQRGERMRLVDQKRQEVDPPRRVGREGMTTRLGSTAQFDDVVGLLREVDRWRQSGGFLGKYVSE